MIPQEIKEQYAFRGGIFTNNKVEIYKFFKTNPNTNDRIKLLKKKYGIGGFGMCGDTPMVLTGADFAPYGKPNHHVIRFRDENLVEHEEYMPLSELVDTIQLLIDNDSYFERKKTVTFEQVSIFDFIGGQKC